MADYPTTAFNPATRSAGQTIASAHINALQDEVRAFALALLSTGLEHNFFPESTVDARTLGTSTKYWGLSYLKALCLLDAAELTIASGAVTVTQGYHRLDTESDAASDDLDTITAGSGIAAGTLLVLRAENVARVVTLKDGTGNLLLDGDYALNATDRTITLIYDGTNWRETARSVGSDAKRLLKANSGTTTNASAENVDTVAISGLTAKDTLLVYYTLQAVTQATATPILQNSTDTVTVSELFASGGTNGNPGAGTTAQGSVVIEQSQNSATSVLANCLGNTSGGGSLLADQTVSTFTTDWTGSWTLALRHGGVTAGGTLRWTWKVYKVLGQ